MNKTFKKRINGTIDQFDSKGTFLGNFWSNDASNPNSLDYDAWLAEGNVPEWSNAESLEDAKQDKINLCLEYLSSTDWYVVRMSDISSQAEIPSNVVTNRANARSLQVNIEACTTLEELNNINIDFS